ncbi:MAG: YggT family protein [Treponema sp.]|nr:YggT family protein [Treponema sp.]
MVVLNILAALILLYTVACFVAVILTWFPGAKFTAFGRVLSKVTDPYMNFFRRIRWMRVGYVDFSPILALAVLSLASSILSGITATGRISFGGTLSSIILMVWGLARSVLILFFVIVLVRFIVVSIKGYNDTYGSPWQALDQFLGGFVQRAAEPFYKKGDYKGQLLVTVIEIAVVLMAGNFLFSVLDRMCRTIPF